MVRVCGGIRANAEFSDAAGIGKQFLDEIKATGAVLSGRNTVEQVDHWGGDHHDGVPIFVPSHRTPGPSVAKYPLVTYVTDGIASAMAQAKVAAGDSDVLVHGAYTHRQRLPQVSSTSCRSTRSRCCSAVGDVFLTCCRRGLSWRLFE